MNSGTFTTVSHELVQVIIFLLILFIVGVIIYIAFAAFKYYTRR